MRLKTIESEFRQGGYDDHPYGESTAREYYRDYIAGTIEVFDVDTSEWGDDVPDEILDRVWDEIMEHHGISIETCEDNLETEWFSNEGKVYIDYSN